jgi:transposase
MPKVSKLLDERVVETAIMELKKLGKCAPISRKLQAVISANKHGITEVAKIYDVSRTTLTEWIKHVKYSTIERLQAPPERKRKSKLNEQQRKQIKEWITGNPNITIRELKIEIERKLGVILGKSTVHRVIKNLSFSYITPRPKHYKQNEALAEEFKKKSR